jgi:hypothetical protein
MKYARRGEGEGIYFIIDCESGGALRRFKNLDSFRSIQCSTELAEQNEKGL